MGDNHQSVAKGFLMAQFGNQMFSGQKVPGLLGGAMANYGTPTNWMPNRGNQSATPPQIGAPNFNPTLNKPAPMPGAGSNPYIPSGYNPGNGQQLNAPTNPYIPPGYNPGNGQQLNAPTNPYIPSGYNPGNGQQLLGGVPAMKPPGSDMAFTRPGVDGPAAAPTSNMVFTQPGVNGPAGLPNLPGRGQPFVSPGNSRLTRRMMRGM